MNKVKLKKIWKEKFVIMLLTSRVSFRKSIKFKDRIIVIMALKVPVEYPKWRALLWVLSWNL